MWLKQWRKRYFSLKGNKLYFATSPKVLKNVIFFNNIGSSSWSY